MNRQTKFDSAAKIHCGQSEGKLPNSRRVLFGIVLFGTACLLAAPVGAGVIYDESVSGDLSNSGLSPTVLTLSLGSNQVLGTTGAQATSVDRDYFTFTVPSGLELSSLVVLPGTQNLGPAGDSFIGVEAGSQVTVSTSPADASGLLGWTHYDAADIGKNILPIMGSSDLGSTGFTPPLPSGTYAFWVQEGNLGTVHYGFDFTLASVPEPRSWAVLLMGMALLGIRGALKYRSAIGRR